MWLGRVVRKGAPNSEQKENQGHEPLRLGCEPLMISPFLSSASLDEESQTKHACARAQTHTHARTHTMAGLLK